MSRRRVRSSALGLFALLGVSGTACDLDFTIQTGGAGGQKATSTSTQPSTNASVSGSTNASTTDASGSSSEASGSIASSSSGVIPDPLSVYKRTFPLNMTGWSKSSFESEYGTDPNIPKDGIVAAVKLQVQPVLLLLTSDNMVHKRSNGVWSTQPIDTLFPPPSAACKHDNLPPCDGIGDTGTCSPVSATGVLSLGHVPALGGTCGSGGTNEDIVILGPTVATNYTLAASGTATFQVQRDYKIDCYADDYPSNVNPIWDFEIFDPSGCGTDPTFYQIYRRMTDGKLRYVHATTPSGMNSGIWTDTDPNNPLFPTPPLGNQPVPSQVVAAYFDQGVTPKTGTIVLIAP